MKRNVLACLVLTLAACTTDVSVDNSPGHIVSVGPVWLDGERLVLELATWDHEGDALTIEAVVKRAVGEHALSDQALAPYSLASLPTERGRETQHVLEWSFGLDGVGPDEEITLEFRAPDADVPVVSFGPFVPSAVAPQDPVPPPSEER